MIPCGPMSHRAGRRMRLRLGVPQGKGLMWQKSTVVYASAAGAGPAVRGLRTSATGPSGARGPSALRGPCPAPALAARVNVDLGAGPGADLPGQRLGGLLQADGHRRDGRRVHPAVGVTL